MGADTVFPASSLNALVSTLTGLGFDRRRLLAAAGVDEAILQDVSALVASDAWAQVWSAARTASDRPALPTEVGLAVPFGALGLVDYLVGSAGTVRQGIETLIARFGGIASLVSFELKSDEGLIRLIGHGAAPENTAEFAVALLISRLRRLSEVSIMRVELVGAATPERAQEVLLGVPAVYGMTRAGVKIAPEHLDRPTRAADAGLFNTLDRLAARLGMGPAEPHFERAVRAEIRARLADQRIDAASLARALGMSERTLGRRLAGHGTRFRPLLDQIRADEAERLLLAGHPVADVALAVGYAEQSAFTRAFRRWKGTTPSAWLSGHALN